jgi:signal transduction histidine kinase
MIKKLRFRLLLASILALFIVLAVIIGILNGMNFRNVISDSDEVLSILAENNGQFPSSEAPAKTDGHRETDHSRTPRRSAELPYESRYFSVLFSSDGSVIETNTKGVAAIGKDTAVSYAQQALSGGKDKGMLFYYRFMRSQEENGTRLIFLDCGRQLDSFFSVLRLSIIISLLGLLAVSVLIFIFSSRIVRPISESYEKQRRFITDAGHEIKTPLTIIDADATVLEMDIGENEWLDDIRAQTKRLASLTNDLVFLSRMDEAQAAATMIEFPLSDIVMEAAESFQALAKSQDKTFTVDVAPMLSMTGDQKNIRQLLSVLLDNAFKYSPEGGYVSLNAHKTGKGIELSVENSCGHIDKKKLPHLFDRFYRAEESHNSQTGGYGIGLSIAQAIVASHKGKITATATDDHSLNITAVFPQKMRDQK